MKKIFVLIGLVVTVYQVKSCDACGGSLGSTYFGMLPQMSNGFVGFNYYYSQFSAAMRYDSEVFEDEFSDDQFHRFEIATRFSLAKRLQASVVLPYSFNHMNGTIEEVKTNGLGDPSVLLSYRLLDDSDDDKLAVNQTLLVGLGVKLPLGKFDQSHEGEVINRNFQLGTGSLDYIFSANHTLMFEKIGINTDLSAKFNTANAEEYRFGNQWAGSSNVFWVGKLANAVMVPMTGLYYEYGAMHTNGQINELNTGGEALMMNVATQIMTKKFTFTASYKVPLYQNFNSDNIADISAQNRVSLGLNYNF